jgi:hypothetical protein
MNVPPHGENPQKRLEICLQSRQLEIDLFWKRSLFFWGFIASAFIAFMSVYRQSLALSILIAAFGMVCSLTWTLANRGSKRWQEHWESKVERFEDEAVGPLFKTPVPLQDKGLWLSARKYSVSKLAIALSDYVLLLWLGLFIHQAGRSVLPPACQGDLRDIMLLSFAAFSVGYLVLLLWKGRSSPDED